MNRCRKEVAKEKRGFCRTEKIKKKIEINMRAYKIIKLNNFTLSETGNFCKNNINYVGSSILISS